MSIPPIQLLCAGSDFSTAQAALQGSDFGPFATRAVADLQQALQQLEQQAPDALLVALPDDATRQQAVPMLSQAAGETAVLVVLRDALRPFSLQLLQLGVQEVLSWEELSAPSWPRRLRAAVERKRVERELRMAHATDLMTGLPNRHQLLEHLSQLLAMRERESALLAVLVLRIDGLPAVEAGYGLESANVVRRKVAVRLRAGVRASDVVASLGVDVFAVLLPSAETPAGAEQVVEKLGRALRAPFTVAGNAVALSAHIGMAQFPRDGAHADALLRHALALALGGAYGPQDAAND